MSQPKDSQGITTADEGVRLACYTLVGELAGGLTRRVGEWLVDDPLGFARPGAAERQHHFLHMVAVRLNKHRCREWLSHVADTSAKLVEKKEAWEKTGQPSCVLEKLAGGEDGNKNAKPFLRKPLTAEDVKKLLVECHGSVRDWPPELTAAALLAMAQISDSSPGGTRGSGGDVPLNRICTALLPPGDPADRPLPRPLENALGEVFLPSQGEPGKLVLGCLTPPFEKAIIRFAGIYQEYEMRGRTQVQHVRTALSRYRDGEICDDAGELLLRPASGKPHILD